MSEIAEFEREGLEAEVYENARWLGCVDCEAEYIMKPKPSPIRCPRCGSIRFADLAVESITEARASYASK